MRSKIIASVFAFCLILGLARAGDFAGTTRLFPQWTHTTTGETTVRETFDDSLYSWTHTSGTNINQMNMLWHDTLSIAASGTNTVGITGGITNAFGEVLTMNEVSFVFVISASANDGTLRIGGGTNAFSSWFTTATDELVLRPGGAIMLTAPDAAGYAAGSGNMRFINTGTGTASVVVYLGGSGS